MFKGLRILSFERLGGGDVEGQRGSDAPFLYFYGKYSF